MKTHNLVKKMLSPKPFSEIKIICIFEKLHIFLNKMFVKSSKHDSMRMLNTRVLS